MQTAIGDKSELGKCIAAVMERNGEKWLRFVLKVLGNEADAQDVLQEAVRRVLVRNRLFTAEDQVRKYLGRAISNTAIELYYSRKRDRSRQVPLQENTLPRIQYATPYTVLEEREDSARRESMMQVLDEALSRLPPKQYQALRMTLLEPGNNSIRDAGAINGIAYSTLRHRSLQGVLRLRKSMRQVMRTGNLEEPGRLSATSTNRS